MSYIESREIPEDIKVKVRATLLSSDRGVPAREFLQDYMKCVEERLDFRKLGYKTLIEMAEDLPDVVRIDEKNGEKHFYGVGKPNTFMNKHMIKAQGLNQRKLPASSNKGHDSMGDVKSSDPYIDREADLQPNLRGLYSLCFHTNEIQADGSRSIDECVQELFRPYGEVKEAAPGGSFYFVRYGKREEALKAYRDLKDVIKIRIPKERSSQNRPNVSEKARPKGDQHQSSRPLEKPMQKLSPKILGENSESIDQTVLSPNNLLGRGQTVIRQQLKAEKRREALAEKIRGGESERSERFQKQLDRFFADTDDDAPHKLFFGNLPRSWTQTNLEDLLIPYGADDIQLITKETSKHGYALLPANQVARVVREIHGANHDGNTLIVDSCNTKAQRKARNDPTRQTTSIAESTNGHTADQLESCAGDASSEYGNVNGRASGTFNRNSSGGGFDLYVGNFPFGTTEEELMEIFSDFSPIASKVKLNSLKLSDKYNTPLKTYGFVTLPSPELASKATEQLQGKPIKGRPLCIKNNAYVPQKDRAELFSNGTWDRSGVASAESAAVLPQSTAGKPVLEIEVGASGNRTVRVNEALGLCSTGSNESQLPVTMSQRQLLLVCARADSGWRLPRLPAVHGDVCTVVVTHVVDSNFFWCFMVKRSGEMRRMFEMLNGDELGPISSWQEGSNRCAAFYKRAWYRGLVEEVKDTAASVYLPDLGLSVTLPTDQLCTLEQPQAWFEHALAVPCKTANDAAIVVSDGTPRDLRVVRHLDGAGNHIAEVELL